MYEGGLRPVMRVMGLDVGSKTIGIALSDPARIVSQPFSVIKRVSNKHDINELCRVIEDKEVSLIVVGLPKNTDGSLGKSAIQVMQFMKVLKKHSSVPLVTWDERFSTVAAERTLISADVSRQKRKDVIDSVAAALILDSYLEYLRQRRDISSSCESKDFAMENIPRNRAAERDSEPEDYV